MFCLDFGPGFTRDYSEREIWEEVFLYQSQDRIQLVFHSFKLSTSFFFQGPQIMRIYHFRSG